MSFIFALVSFTLSLNRCFSKKSKKFNQCLIDILNSSYSVKICGVLVARNVFKIKIDRVKRDLKKFIKVNLSDGN